MPKIVNWYAGAGDYVSHAVSTAAVPDVSGYLRTLCGLPSAHIGADQDARCAKCDQIACSLPPWQS